ncbi:PQQ-like beta-propeller repeat protein [Polystyrenella longa]|nr:PQQ-binding-like beta-propeller repeat protein [Polystyrenella longa]
MLVWLSLLCWMSPQSLFADPGGLQERLHPPPDEPIASSDHPSLESFQNRQALLPLLYRDRHQEAVYHEISRAFEAGRTVEALQLLQQLFDSDEDSFYWPSTSPAPVSIRYASRSLFFQQSPDVWQLYEQLNASTANALLEDAQGQQDKTCYHDLIHRFPFTSAGREARRHLIYYALDRHRFHEAHHHLNQLFHSKIHQEALHESDHHLHRFLKHQIQPDSWNESIAQDYELRTAMVEGNNEIGYPILQVSQSDTEENYFATVAHGKRRTHWQEVTPPYLREVWSASHMNSSRKLLDQTMQFWEEEQASELKPAAVGWKPVVVGETVYVRNYDEVTAFDLHSGSMLWRYPCQSQFSPLLESFRPHSRLHSRTQFSQLTSELNLEELLVGNNLLGTLTHDSERLYLIDEVELEALKAPVPAGIITHADNPHDNSEARRRSNRLIALPLSQTETLQSLPVKPEWSVGGILELENTRLNNALSGHFILGPPLVDGGTLFVLSEFEQQINLSALNAENGKLLWTQGIGWVEFMIDQDVFRSHRSATPILAHNLLLCPCQTGMLVAVDRSSGTLRWVYDYRELNESQRHRHWSRRRNSQRGHLGFDDQPVVQGDRVLYLPHQSENLHCLDLNTGRVVWKEVRKDADYIATSDHNLAFVVGRKSCRGLSLRNGSEVWSARLGTPSGTGTRAGHVYLLPLQSGRIASINIQTGDYSGLSHLHTRVESDLVQLVNQEAVSETSYATTNYYEEGFSPGWTPGNLIACQDYILSAGPRGITLFPQSGSELYRNPVHADRTIEMSSGDEKIRETSVTDAFLRQAELNLILDRLEEAQQYLERCLETKDSLITEQRYMAEHLLQEVLYARLRSEPASRDLHFTKLQSFVHGDLEQGRLLMEEAEFQLANGNHQTAWQRVVDLSTYDLNLPLNDTTDATWKVTPRSWIPLMRERLISTGGNDFLHLLEVQCERYLDDALNEELSEKNEGKLEIFLTLFGEGEPAAVAKLKLAARYREEGKYHLAEQLWMSVRETRFPRLASIASQNLITLWRQFGMYQLAANEIESSGLSSHYAATHYNGTEIDSMLQLCLKQSQRPDEKIAHVRISERRWSDEGTDMQGYRIALHPTATQDFTLLTKGSGHTGKLTLLDRLSGQILDDVDVPTGTLSNQLSRHQLSGTQLCLGGSNTAIGLSLLTRKPVWEVSPVTNLRTESLSVFTINSNFTVLRNRHQMAVVDTATGNVLWQRDKISPAGNRINTGQAGVMGDNQSLIMFEDHLNYTVFDIRTGDERRQGQFAFDPSERHYIFGRKIFYFEPNGDENSIGLYDPHENRYLMRRSSNRAVLSVRTSDDKLALLSPVDGDTGDGAVDHLRLEIIDPEMETRLLDYKLKDELAQKLSFLRVFDDRDHYYVNLQHHEKPLDLPRQFYPAGDTLLNNVTIRGKLLAFEKKTGKLLWMRDFQPASVIQLAPHQLPILILVSRTRDRMNPSLHSLAIETVDARTGESLGYHDEILTDRLVHAAYDPDARRVSLIGHRTCVHLDMHSKKEAAWKEECHYYPAGVAVR